MKSLNLDMDIKKGEGEKASIKSKTQPKKEVKKMDDETSYIIKKMKKIDIGKDEKEAEEAIKKAMTGK